MSMWSSCVVVIGTYKIFIFTKDISITGSITQNYNRKENGVSNNNKGLQNL